MDDHNPYGPLTFPWVPESIKDSFADLLRLFSKESLDSDSVSWKNSGDLMLVCE